MLFNDDILFRNGSLALVWMAGSGNLPIKNRRSKEFQRILQAKVVVICKELRALLPQMGTAYGIGLKKMGTLICGAGSIHYIKMQQFSREVYQATLTLKRRLVIPEEKINLPPLAKSKSTAKTAITADELPNANATGFGELDQFGLVDYENGEARFGTPRAMPSNEPTTELGGPIPPFRLQATPPRDGTMDEERAMDNWSRNERKRRKEDENLDSEEAIYRDVMERLRNKINLNPRANCIVEDVPLIPPDPQIDPEFESDLAFGDGIAMLFDGDNGNVDAIPRVEAGRPGEANVNDLPPLPPAEDDFSGVGLPSRVELESAVRVLETPSGVGTHPENRRRRRNEIQEDPDSTMELDLQVVDTARQRRRVRARRRLRLQIDQEIDISLKDMLTRVNEITAGHNHEMLLEQLRKNQAPGKSSWKTISGRTNPLKFIISSGRPCRSAALNEMVEKIAKEQMRRSECTELPTHAAGEEQREQGDQTTEGGISGRSNIAHAQIELEPIAPSLVSERDPVDFIPLPSEADSDFNSRVGGDGFIITGPEPDFPAMEERSPPRRSTRQSRIDEGSKLTRNLEGNKKFSELYPPTRINRRRAAFAFFTLLKMQAKKEVLLHQEEPYGSIIVEQLNCPL